MQTDNPRSSLNPTFFLYRHFYFSMFISLKKKEKKTHVYHTFIASDSYNRSRVSRIGQTTGSLNIFRLAISVFRFANFSITLALTTLRKRSIFSLHSGNYQSWGEGYVDLSYFQSRPFLPITVVEMDILYIVTFSFVLFNFVS